MITFSVKFLLAFSLKTKDKPEKKHKEEKPTGKKKTVAVEKSALKDETESYVFHLDKNFANAHIEYEILPGKGKPYQIDVLCWKNGAKIFTPDGTKLFKPFSRNGLVFVPVCVEHVHKEMSIEELMALKNSVIEFHIFGDKNKLGTAAKANKTGTIYIKETDIGKEGFIDGYPEKVNMSKKSGRISEDTTSHSTATAQRTEPFSRLRFYENYADTLYEIIDYLVNESTSLSYITFRDFVRPNVTTADASPQTEETKRKAKKEGQSSKSTKSTKADKQGGKMTLQVQGEIFFTDADAIFKVENSRSEIRKVVVLPRADNLLTRLQKIHLNPIIVKVMAVENFPSHVFNSTSFSNVYCQYSIPGIAECKTVEKPIEKNVKFMESHFYPTHTFSKIKLLEFLKTRRLVVELYGVQQRDDKIVSPKMYGEKEEDKNISKIRAEARKTAILHQQSAKTKNILLAYCSFDLSSLLKNVWDFRAKEQMHTVESRIMPDLKSNSPEENYTCEFWYKYGGSVNQVALAGISFDNTDRSPLKEWILIQNNTVLTLEAYLLSPQSAALVLHQIPNTFKRLMVIAFNRQVVKSLLESIVRHNQTIICGNLRSEDLLTGFVLDNGNHVAVYTEGPSIGYILNLWNIVGQFTPKEAKVFFNTDQTYENRLYNVCNKWAGFYVVVTKIPLEDIFKNQKVYVKGNMPLSCQKAITKLNLMFLTSTMNAMFQYDLFPNLEEFLSFDLEYGVPFSWKVLRTSLQLDYNEYDYL